MINDNLRYKLVDTISNVVEVHLSEASEETYPYVVYDMTTSPDLSKDGIEGYTGDAKIRIVGQSLDALDDLRNDIQLTIEEEMHSDVYGAFLVDVTKECVEDLWTIEMNYTLKQYA